MDFMIIPLVLVVLVWTEAILSPPPAPPAKSVEDQLGEALGKYLANGIKINVQMKDK